MKKTGLKLSELIVAILTGGLTTGAEILVEVKVRASDVEQTRLRRKDVDPVF